MTNWTMDEELRNRLDELVGLEELDKWCIRHRYECWFSKEDSNARDYSEALQWWLEDGAETWSNDEYDPEESFEIYMEEKGYELIEAAEWEDRFHEANL